jgi:hypothetical protein
MTWKARLTLLGSAFGGAALNWVGAHLSSGALTNMQAAEAMASGAIFAGFVAVVHLYQPAPVSPPCDPVTKAANDVRPL